MCIFDKNQIKQTNEIHSDAQHLCHDLHFKCARDNVNVYGARVLATVLSQCISYDFLFVLFLLVRQRNPSKKTQQQCSNKLKMKYNNRNFAIHSIDDCKQWRRMY